MNAFEQLNADIARKNSVVCVGLDPMKAQSAQEALEFSKKIIDLTHDVAVAFKPQIAYFEVFGATGWQAYKDTIAYIHSKGVLAIDDAKRGDIGSTCEAYAKAHFEELGADFVTVNPYMGSDGLKPFLAYADKGIFVLCRTSNPSAEELQDKLLYGKVAKLIESCGGGAVVGATSPTEAKELRGLMPKAMWLVPGYGAQGGTAQSVKNCFLPGGLGAIISASRSVIYAADPRAAALTMRDELNKVRNV